MAISIQLDVVIPDRLLVSKEVTSVSVPGSEGEFGVLPDHTPLMSGVEAGELTIDDGDKPGERFAVSNGYVEVTGDKVTVLVDRAVVKEEIDVKSAKADLDSALQFLETAAQTSAQSKKIDPEVIMQKRNRDFAQACILVHDKKI